MHTSTIDMSSESSTNNSAYVEIDTLDYPPSNYTYDLSTITPGIRKLILRSPFNQPIKNEDLPSGLKILSIHNRYTTELEIGSIPEGLEELVLEGWYPYRLKKNILPRSLKKLEIHCGYEGGLDIGSLPIGLTELTITCNKQNIVTGLLPYGLEKIVFHEGHPEIIEIGAIPNSVETIIFKGTHRGTIKPGTIPSSVKYLVLGYWFNESIEIGSLPDGLIELDCGENYNKIIMPGVLPQSLKKLKLGDYFCQEILPNTIPENLKEIELGPNFRGYVANIPRSTTIYSIDKFIPGAVHIYVDVNCNIDSLKKINATVTPCDYTYRDYNTYLVRPLRFRGIPDDNIIKNLSENITENIAELLSRLEGIIGPK